MRLLLKILFSMVLFGGCSLNDAVEYQSMPDIISPKAVFSDCDGEVSREKLESRLTSVVDYASRQFDWSGERPTIITTEFYAPRAQNERYSARTTNHFQGNTFIPCQVIYRLPEEGDRDFLVAHEFAHVFYGHHLKNHADDIRQHNLSNILEREISATEWALGYMDEYDRSYNTSKFCSLKEDRRILIEDGINNCTLGEKSISNFELVCNTLASTQKRELVRNFGKTKSRYCISLCRDQKINEHRSFHIRNDETEQLCDSEN